MERSPVFTGNRPWGDSRESAHQKGPCALPQFPSVLPLSSDSRGAPSSLYWCWFWGENQHAVREVAGHQPDGCRAAAPEPAGTLGWL